MTQQEREKHAQKIIEARRVYRETLAQEQAIKATAQKATYAAWERAKIIWDDGCRSPIPCPPVGRLVKLMPELWRHYEDWAAGLVVERQEQEYAGYDHATNKSTYRPVTKRYIQRVTERGCLSATVVSPDAAILRVLPLDDPLYKKMERWQLKARLGGSHGAKEK